MVVKAGNKYPKFTKKHFDSIAETLRGMPVAPRKKQAKLFAEKFAEDNPKFDKTRFMKACELK